ncbi:MAG TPA: tetratricopeptide repeat protein [Blastocatellia bacterium]|nr:tetratricopeptide repeat protein [Blastocatellia bacterium]
MYDEAIVALSRAIDLSNGKLSKAYFNLGCALIKAGREEEGLAALRTYLEREPSTADFRGRLHHHRREPGFEPRHIRGLCEE